MIKDDIIHMAQEAGFDALCRNDDFSCNVKDIERLVIAAYAAGAKDEREACAKVIENECHDDMTRAEEAAAIRARGEK